MSFMVMSRVFEKMDSRAVFAALVKLILRRWGEAGFHGKFRRKMAGFRPGCGEFYTAGKKCANSLSVNT
jgi:hypothetical protein